MSHDTRLFVGNLPDNADEYALRQVFSPFGRITNLDLKSKVPVDTNTAKRFAFVTLSATHNDIESCIKHFTSVEFKGSNLYVTRARESFLERLQRERQEALLKEVHKNSAHKGVKKQPIIKLDEKLNPRKRQLTNSDRVHDMEETHHKLKHHDISSVWTKSQQYEFSPEPLNDKSPKNNENVTSPENKKKLASDMKRLESMKRMREEFKQKKMIINTGLSDIDLAPRKKVIFSDSDEIVPVVPINSENIGNTLGNTLFDNDDDSGDDLNFTIKEHYEGANGQKVLELQSRYKSDKRFKLDERFVDDNDRPLGAGAEAEADESVDVSQADEKARQFNILQDVLGIPAHSFVSRHELKNDKKKIKSKLGMLRYDPMQPEHAKFLAPVEETNHESGKKSKMKKCKEDEHLSVASQQNVDKVEVSKETFYKVSDTLKEIIAQSNTFSLRSLFNRDEDNDDEHKKVEEVESIAIEKPKEPQVRNPFHKEANPFKYDSSESEIEEETSKTDENYVRTELQTVWNEPFFFYKSDPRLEEGVAFFIKSNDGKGQKERRELKSLMKKRQYNRERKDQMFKKKIGGHRKSAKKSYRKRRN